MSKLQTALHAYPPGSPVTKQMRKADQEFEAQLDQERNDEIAAAKQYQADTGCTWSEALQAIYHP